MKKIDFIYLKSSCLCVVLLLLAGTVTAQTKLGDNPSTIQSGSLLELESLSKGLRLPRIALNDVSLWTLDGTAVSGMLIYNESGTVPKGIYYWNTTLTQWVRVVNTTELTALTSSLTVGSVPFIGTGGALSQNNTNFFWDNTNKRLGIGTAAPGSALEVNGASTNTTAYNGGSATTIDFSKSNLAYTTASAGAFTLTGLKDGGTYTLAVQGTTSGTSTFSGTNPSAAALTFKSTNNAATTASTHTVYTFIVMGTMVYYWMNAGF